MNKFIFKIFILLQILVISATLLGINFLSEQPNYLGKGLKELTNQPLIYSRANFDGFHYTKIARDGYGYLQQAFFPFYPKLIRFFKPFFGSYILSGLFISNLTFLFALIFLAKLLVLEGLKEELIKRVIVFLCLFPTSFYFLGVYTESLFFFLLILSFFLAKKKQWLGAGLVAGLASYTRLIGIFILPALLIEYYQQCSFLLKKRIINFKNSPLKFFDKNLLFIFLSCWGLVVYAFFLKKTTGDPLYFFRVQPQFGAQRSADKIILLYQVFWRYLKMIFTVNPTNLIYFNVWLEFLSALSFLGILILGYFIKINLSYLVFSGLALITPTLTGTFSSLPRYVLPLFPGFITLAILSEKYRFIKIFYPIISLILLIFSVILFARGYWVS